MDKNGKLYHSHNLFNTSVLFKQLLFTYEKQKVVLVEKFLDILKVKEKLFPEWTGVG